MSAALRGARQAAFALAALLATGCVDFIDPVFPNAGAPALVSVSVSIQENSSFFLSGRVQPGRDSTGRTRVPADSTLRFLELALEPDTVEARNTLVFTEFAPIIARDPRQPITLAAPPIHGILATPPQASWYGIVKVGTDTLSVVRGQDLVLQVQSRLGTAEPPVQVRQWFLDLNGPDGTFRLSGTGFPPDTLRIPTQWIPASGPAAVTVNLIYYQSAVLRPPPGDYIGSYAVDSRLQWSVRVR